MNDLNRLKRAYELLNDDLSKKVFEKRRLYAQTGKMEHLLDLIQDSYRGLKRTYKSNTSLIELARTVLKRTDSGSGKTRMIIWGAGNGATTPLQLIHEYGFTGMQNVECMFCDNNPLLWGSIREHHNPKMRLPIISPNEARKFSSDDHTYIIISTLSRSASDSIFEQCISLGFPRNRIVEQEDSYEYFIGNMYFDPEIVYHRNNEVFVDAGAYDMRNTQEFIRWCDGDYDKIYAFEADNVSYEKCRKIIELSGMNDVELINAGVHSRDTKLSFLSAPDGEYGGSRFDNTGSNIVDAVSLDKFLDGRPVTFIKMDIEGAELDALQGAANTIRQQKPKLALSAYHKPWDIVELPLYIHSLNPGYKFYLRHHTFGIFDTVLYAV
jgi:FkbM family methyltransferase